MSYYTNYLYDILYKFISDIFKCILLKYCIKLPVIQLHIMHIIFAKLSSFQFCKMVISTTEESKKLQRKMMEKKDRKRKVEVDRRGKKELNISYVKHINNLYVCRIYIPTEVFIFYFQRMDFSLEKNSILLLICN